jgi:hypothetical protein
MAGAGPIYLIRSWDVVLRTRGEPIACPYIADIFPVSLSKFPERPSCALIS